jgi:pyruvate formate lyase activating enzyme
MVRVKLREDVSRFHIVQGSTGNVAIYSHHMHTAIETSGFLGVRATDQYLQQLDLVILDIKSGDPETYCRTTKRNLEPTVRFAERLAAIHKPVWVRFTLVPGLTNDPANVEAVAKFVAPMKNVEWVEVLPFHQLGAFKWKSPQFLDSGCNAR